jgi:hypothetical protein
MPFVNSLSQSRRTSTLPEGAGPRPGVDCASSYLPDGLEQLEHFFALGSLVQPAQGFDHFLRFGP